MKSIFPATTHVLLANGTFKKMHSCKPGDVLITSHGICNVRSIGLPKTRLARAYKSNQWHTTSFALQHQLFAETTTSWKTITDLEAFNTRAFKLAFPSSDHDTQFDYDAGYVYGVTKATGTDTMFVPISNIELMNKFKMHHDNVYGTDTIDCTHFSCNSQVNSQDQDVVLTQSFCKGVIDGINDNIKYNFNLTITNRLYELLVICKTVAEECDTNQIDSINFTKSAIESITVSLESDASEFLFCDNAWTCGELI